MNQEKEKEKEINPINPQQTIISNSESNQTQASTEGNQVNEDQKGGLMNMTTTNSTSLSPVYLSSPSSTSISSDQLTSSSNTSSASTSTNLLSQPTHISTSTSSPTSSPKPTGTLPLAHQKQPQKPSSTIPVNPSLRLRKGMKLEDAYPTPFSIHGEGLDPSSFLHSIESPFQVQEYIALLVRADPHDVDQIVSLPSPSSHSNHQSTPATPTTSPLVPQEVWIYEQLRRFSQDLSHPFVSTLQSECSRTTCPEMKAGEWLYLCAAHATANENDCCAIDYIVHTLDGATALLNSARYFPSRLQIPTTSIKHFTSIARRLYRIFAHAWFHHRDVFDQCETETSLYARFLALTDRFSLISEDLLVIPRMNGEEEREEETEENESSGSGEKQETMDDDELEELE